MTAELPHQMAGFFGPGAYQVTARLPRSGLIFARLSMTSPHLAFTAPAAEDYVLAVHLSDHDLELRCEDGFHYNGPVAAGHYSLCPGGPPAEIRIAGAIDIIKVFLPREAVANAAAELLGAPIAPYWSGFRFDAQLLDQVRRAEQAAASGDRVDADALAFDVLTRVMLLHSAERPAGGGPANWRGGLAGWQLRRVLDYLDAHLDQEVTVLRLAEEAGLSPFHFIRAFRQSTGLTPHAWLFRRRIARAKELLTGQELRVSDIATRVGYATTSALSSAFTRGTGVSPSQWRRARTGTR